MSYKMKRDGILHDYLINAVGIGFSYDWKIATNVCLLFWQVVLSLIGSIFIMGFFSLIGYGILFNIITLFNGDIGSLVMESYSVYFQNEFSLFSAIGLLLVLSELLTFMVVGLLLFLSAIALTLISIMLVIVGICKCIKYFFNKTITPKMIEDSMLVTFIRDKLNKMCTLVEIVDE